VATKGRFKSNPNLTHVKKLYIYNFFFYFFFHPSVIFSGPYFPLMGLDFDYFSVIGFVLASFTQQWACNHFWRL